MKFIVFILSFHLYAQKLEPRKIIHEVDERYLSIALDTALLVGSYWWNESGEAEGGRGRNKIDPYNILNPTFINRVKALSPAYFRIGGSEADDLFYAIEKENTNFDSQLTKKMVLNLKKFIEKTNTKLFFTLNSGPKHWKNKKYNSKNVKLLIDYFKQNEIPAVYELGNEVLAYWAIFGIGNEISTDQYADAFRKVKKENDIKLGGAASAFWPLIGEPMGFYFGKVFDVIKSLQNDIDIITWHYYPVQSSRCPVAIRRANLGRFFDPKVLDAIVPYAQDMKEAQMKSAPHAQLWMGETGSAQCGGMRELSDTFLGSLWWADELGALALYKHDVVIRQSILGGDYALLDFDTLKPRPDYWLSLLWKRLMGKKVIKLNYENKDQSLRIYQHCHPLKGSTTLYINISNTTRSLTFDTNRNYYQLTSKNLDKNVFLNGYIINNIEDLNNYATTKNFKLPKRSITFVHNPLDQFCSTN